MTRGDDDVRDALGRVFAAEPPVRLTRTDLQGRVARLRRRRLAVAPVGTALALSAAVLGLAVFPRDAGPTSGLPASGLPASVRADLGERARDALEGGAAPALGAAEGGLACAVEVLGTEPADVTDAGQARTVYAWARCETVGTEVATGSSVPVAVRLTRPPTAQVPGDGPSYWPDVERLFPPALLDVVRDGANGFPDLESRVADRVRERS